DEKLYLLAELSVKPHFVEEVKSIFSRLLPTVLKEQGCEAMYTTSIDGIGRVALNPSSVTTKESKP
ncbi:MAG TPA: hypothetical protein VGM27_30730, partial [Acidobacteriaceae bacterium]